MGRKGGHNARGNLRSEKTMQPSLGAYHPVVNSAETLEEFYDDVDEILRYHLTDEWNGLDSNCKNMRRRRGYSMYDDPDRAGVRVLERRLSANHAKRQRLKWTKQDIGRVRGMIQDEIGRYEFGLKQTIPARFVNVARFGDADAQQRNNRVLGLVLDAKSETADFLAEEHGIVVNGIATALDRFRYPYSEYLPHMSVGRIYRDVEPSKIGKVIEGVEALLPLDVELAPIRFVSEQDI